MHIGELYSQLIEEARRRVSAGLVTERHLARLCGISQPHMHNVLKNFRSLSSDSADRLMATLNLDIPELMFRFQKVGDLSVRAVPIVRSRVGPGFEPNLTSFRGFMPFSAMVVDSMANPIVVQVAQDMVLPKSFNVNDFVLLDQDPAIRRRPGGKGCWLVSEGLGIRLRYVRLGGTRVYIANEATVHDPARWNAITLKGKEILDIVLARAVWVGRTITHEDPGPENPPPEVTLGIDQLNV